nr:PD-(D/E)XK nuclease family transposase [uncultured Anaerobutyricum sp.]
MRDVRDVRALRLEGIEERYERYKEKIKNYTIMDDIFMRNVLKEQGCTEYILQVIMNQKDLQVLEQTLQKDYKNLQGRSAILDCVARDERARQFNVEIQGDNEGASPERARYHSCLLDMNILSPREPFTGLPETYIIFITRNDVLGYNRIICHITRKVEEEGKDFGDGSHIIYVNSKKREDTELGKLMHDLHCKESGEMHSKILASRVRELKETEKGVSEMCRDMEEIYGEGMEEGERKKARETVLSLAELKMSEEQISQIVKMPLEVVQGWIEESLAI